MKKAIKKIEPTLVKIKNNYQITLPRNLRKTFNFDIGDYVEMENRHGRIVMRPVKVVHPDDEYFYTKEWQKSEAQADKDIARGSLVGPFKNMKDALRVLKKTRV